MKKLLKFPMMLIRLVIQSALLALNQTRLDAKIVADTLNLLLKTRADQQLFTSQIGCEGVEQALTDKRNGGEICGCS